MIDSGDYDWTRWEMGFERDFGSFKGMFPFHELLTSTGNLLRRPILT